MPSLFLLPCLPFLLSEPEPDARFRSLIKIAYKVWMEQKKRYSIATDAELWGQKQWDDMMKKLRQMRYGNASNDSDGDFKQCRLRCAEANQAWIIEFIHEGCVVI